MNSKNSDVPTKQSSNAPWESWLSCVADANTNLQNILWADDILDADKKIDVIIKWEQYTFENIIEWEIEQDTISFYGKQWHDNQPDWPTSYQMLNNAKERCLFIVRNNKWVVVWLNAQSPFFSGKHEDKYKWDLWTFIVSPECKWKWIASFLAWKRIALVKNIVSDSSSINIEATTSEGLNFSMRLAEKVKQDLSLTINCMGDAIDTLIDSFFSAFADELNLSLPIDRYDLYNIQDNISIQISQEKADIIFYTYYWNYDSVDELSVSDKIVWIIKELDQNILIDLYKAHDKQELLKKLADIGIVINL